MKEEFREYLALIGVTGILHDRVEEISQFYEAISADPILDIFVEDFIQQDGSREYGSLWFFTENHVMEAKQFVSEDNFDMARLKNGVRRWQLRKQDYDFDKPTTKSRMYVHIVLDVSISANTRASGANCEKLKQVFLKYILPNTSP